MTRPKSGPADPVNAPAHYRKGAVECIDALEAALSREEFVGFLKGQVIKYLWRANHKGNAAQDHAKAAWYLNRLNVLEESPSRG